MKFFLRRSIFLTILLFFIYGICFNCLSLKNHKKLRRKHHLKTKSYKLDKNYKSFTCLLNGGGYGIYFVRRNLPKEETDWIPGCIQEDKGSLNIKYLPQSEKDEYKILDLTNYNERYCTYDINKEILLIILADYTTRLKLQIRGSFGNKNSVRKYGERLNCIPLDKVIEMNFSEDLCEFICKDYEDRGKLYDTHRVRPFHHRQLHCPRVPKGKTYFGEKKRRTLQMICDEPLFKDVLHKTGKSNCFMDFKYGCTEYNYEDQQKYLSLREDL